MAILYVGSGRPYTTIGSAITAASDNDIIGIDSGTYFEAVTIDKYVHLRGNTDTPENGDVIINGGSSSALTIDYSPASYEDIYIEGLQLQRNTVSWSTSLLILGASAQLGLYINRCRVLVGSNMYPINVNNQLLNKLYIEYCYVERGYSHVLNANWDNISEDGIIKVEITNSYFCYQCTGSPNTLDTVSVPTSGYGPEFGTYYKILFQGSFSGYVYEQGSPVSRTLYLYTRSDGAYVDTTTSSGDGSYSLTTTNSGAHFIVCLDDEAGDDFNDLISGNVIPTTVSG